MRTHRIRLNAHLRRDAAPQVAARQDGEAESLVVPGILATQAEVVHYLWGVGFARVILEITDELVNGWDLESLPFMRDHARSIDAAIGRMYNLRVESGDLWVDAEFDPDLGAKYHSAVMRGTLTDLSVTASLNELALVEPGDEDKLPLYRAIDWKPLEGSLVWRGADDAAEFRRSYMDPEQITQALRSIGLDDAQIEAVLAASATTPEAAPDGGTPQPAERAEGDVTEIAVPQDVDSLAAAIVRHMLGQTTTATPAAETQPSKAERAMQVAIGQARKFGIAEEVIERGQAESNGNAESFGLAMRRELERRQQVPEVTPRRVSGGHERRYEALADMAACLRSRCGVASEADQKRISQHGLEPHRTTMVALATRAVQAWNPGQQTTSDPTLMLEEFSRETMHRALPGRIPVLGMPGMRFVQRDSWGGLVPGDLSAVYADVMHKVLMESYDRAALPFDQLARRRDVTDRRVQHMIHTDIAGRFDPLGVGENLKPITVREQDTEFVVHPYGHYHKVEWASFVDDDLGFLQQLPQQLGIWHGSQKTKVFTVAVTAGKLRDGTAIYTGSYDATVADVTDFRAILETIRNIALAATPIPAGANEDPRNDPGKSYALMPTVMLYPHGIRLKWESFAAPQDVDNRADMRVTYERALWSRSHEGLYLPENNWHVWPGPESPFCPFMYGEIVGQGMTLRVGPTGPTEQDGVYVRVTSTFGAAPVRDKTAFRVSPT